MNLVFVMEHNRLLRGNVRGRQWQQSLALDLANCHKDCRKNEQLFNVVNVCFLMTTSCQQQLSCLSWKIDVSVGLKVL